MVSSFVLAVTLEGSVSSELERLGYDCVAVDSISGADQALLTEMPDIILVDDTIPSSQAVKFFASLTKTPPWPYEIIYAALGDLPTMEGVKPFKTLGDFHKGLLINDQKTNKHVIPSGDFAYLMAKKELRYKGNIVPLNRNEEGLLGFLVAHNRSVSHQELMDFLRISSVKTLETRINRLRKTLRDYDAEHEVIRSVWNAGYQFVRD